MVGWDRVGSGHLCLEMSAKYTCNKCLYFPLLFFFFSPRVRDQCLIHHLCFHLYWPVISVAAFALLAFPEEFLVTCSCVAIGKRLGTCAAGPCLTTLVTYRACLSVSKINYSSA